MIHIIKLTRLRTDKTVYVNFENVTYFNDNEKGGARIFLNNDSSNNVINVKENIEKIIELLSE